MNALQKLMVRIGIVSPFAVIMTQEAQAGTTGTEFASMATKLQDWLQNSLGLVIALAAFAFGVGIAAAKQTYIPLAIAVGLAMFITAGPAIIKAMFTAII